MACVSHKKKLNNLKKRMMESLMLKHVNVFLFFFFVLYTLFLVTIEQS